MRVLAWDMPIHLLSISAVDRVNVDPDQADEWKRLIVRRWGRESKLTKVAHAPFEATVELDGQPDQDELLGAIRRAFKTIGASEGRVDVALSAHDAHDIDFETPPYYDETIDLAHLDWVTPFINIATVHARAHGLVGRRLSPEQREAFLRELAALAPSAKIEHSLLADGRESIQMQLPACPLESVPSTKSMLAIALEPAARLGLTPLPFVMVKGNGSDLDWDDRCCVVLESEG